jgi:ribosomal protein S18 acetylase RimI-like enzyme
MELVFIDPKAEGPRYEAEKDLRFRVLREPLGMGRHEVGFVGEEAALHLLAVDSAVVIGCVLFDFETGRLRAMAVDSSRQRQRVGERLVLRLEEELDERGVREVTLHAREPAVRFYERLGYAVRGEPFVEVGITHRHMGKLLQAR